MLALKTLSVNSFMQCGQAASLVASNVYDYGWRIQLKDLVPCAV
jgi:hypothetical protein